MNNSSELNISSFGISISDSTQKQESIYVGKTQKMQKLKYQKWNDEENKKYVNFLEENYSSFKNQHKRRSQQVFFAMSMMIDSRTHEQCRSHHQKLIKKYKTIEKVIYNLRKRRQLNKLKKSKKSMCEKDLIETKVEEKSVEEKNEQTEEVQTHTVYQFGVNIVDELENVPEIDFQFNQNDSELYFLRGTMLFL